MITQAEARAARNREARRKLHVERSFKRATPQPPAPQKHPLGPPIYTLKTEHGIEVLHI